VIEIKKLSLDKFKLETTNMSWLLSELVAKSFLGLLVSILLARYLGVHEYGQLNFVISLTAIFSALIPLGLQNLVIRGINKNFDQTHVYLGTSFFLSTLMACFVYILLIQVIFILRPDDALTRSLVAVAGLGLLFKSTEVIKYWFSSQVMSKYVVWAQSVALLISAAIKTLFILLELELIYFIWAGVVEAGLLCILLWLVYIKNSKYVARWKVSYSKAKNLLKEGWYLLLSSFSVLATLNIDKIFVGQMAGEQELGLYSASSTLAQVWYALPLIIGASFAPSLTKQFTENQKLYKYWVNRIFQLLFWIAVLLSLLITFVGMDIVLLVFGEQFIESSKILIVQIYITIFLFHISFRKRLLIIEGKSPFVFYLSLSMLMCNIALNLLFIPSFGAIGAAYATLLSWIINALVFPLFFKATREHPSSFFSTIFFRKSLVN